MRWPEIFFKSRRHNPLPEIVTVPPKALEPPREPALKRHTARVETTASDQEKTESLRALAESGTGLPPRGAKESPLASGNPAQHDTGNAKTTALPLTQARTGNTSLRQRARLTDDARPLPRQSHVPVTPAPEAPKPDIPAVVPAAFTVPVETGSVLEQTPDKTPDIDSAPLKPAAEKPPTQPLPRRDEPPDVGSPGDTARIHIAHATTSTPPPTAAIEPVKPADSRQKSEFVLANGERIFGHILSETPQTIYLDHGTLGVLTLPRSQIAAKPIEVILINGDRLVGDLIAETPECLYLKHASLGMVTVPHGQRSTRVVEAILKDGDRILGEVLAETDNFTVIRSATLGTVAVQHDQVAMLNRKIEQMQLRALPTSTSPALENKKDQPPL